MTSFFLHRGYSSQICADALAKATAISRTLALTSKKTDKSSNPRPVLSLTYHPHNIPIKDIIIRHFPLLQSDPLLKQIFPLPPLIAYKRDSNLRDHLVSATVRNLPQPSPGNSPCKNPKCPCCPHINPSTVLSGPKNTFHIRSSFDCTSSDIVYVISCRRCQQLYVGETYRDLKTRFSEHLRSIRLPGYQTPVAQHFRQPPHTLTDVLVAAVWHNNSSLARRRHMESFLIKHLGCLSPSGINIRN